MTALPVDPRQRAPDRAMRASAPRSPASLRTAVLAAWSGGPGVLVLSGPARSGLLDALAATLGQAGQPVQFARRGDEAVVPAGPAILLVDEAGRMPDAVIRRLFAHPRLFGVLADGPAFVHRLRSMGLAPHVIDLGGAELAPPGPPRPRRRLKGAVAAGLLAAVLASSAAFLLARESAAPLPPAALPRPAPPLPAPAAPPPVALPAPVVPADLPTGAMATVGIGYAAGSTEGAALAAAVAARLRAAAVATADPVGSARADRPGIRYYFAADRALAEQLRDRLGPILAGLPLELAPAGPATRPGQIDVALGDGRSGAASSGDTTVVRARRVSAGSDGR